MSGSRRHERCRVCDWRDLLTAKETVLLAIQGNTVTVTGISIKLHDLGVRWQTRENEVRARLSELRHDGMVRQEWRGGQVWALTELGRESVAGITPQLYDEELESFSE